MVILCAMMFCLTACGSSVKAGKYNGSSGQSTLEINKDGTCTYTEYGSDVYKGTWKETESGEFEIILDGVNMTLYGSVGKSGDITVTANSSEWTNETFSKE